MGYMIIYIYIFRLVVWNMTLIFPYLGNVIIPTDFHFIIFQRGRAQPPTRYFMIVNPNGMIWSYRHKVSEDSWKHLNRRSLSRKNSSLLNIQPQIVPKLVWQPSKPQADSSWILKTWPMHPVDGLTWTLLPTHKKPMRLAHGGIYR